MCRELDFPLRFSLSTHPRKYRIAALREERGKNTAQWKYKMSLVNAGPDARNRWNLPAIKGNEYSRAVNIRVERYSGTFHNPVTRHFDSRGGGLKIKFRLYIERGASNGATLPRHVYKRDRCISWESTSGRRENCRWSSPAWLRFLSVALDRDIRLRPIKKIPRLSIRFIASIRQISLSYDKNRNSYICTYRSMFDRFW